MIRNRKNLKPNKINSLKDFFQILSLIISITNKRSKQKRYNHNNNTYNYTSSLIMKKIEFSKSQNFIENIFECLTN